MTTELPRTIRSTINRSAYQASQRAYAEIREAMQEAAAHAIANDLDPAAAIERIAATITSQGATK